MTTHDNDRLPIIKKAKDGGLKMNLKGVENIIEIHESDKTSEKQGKREINKKQNIFLFQCHNVYASIWWHSVKNTIWHYALKNNSLK